MNLCTPQRLAISILPHIRSQKLVAGRTLFTRRTDVPSNRSRTPLLKCRSLTAAPPPFTISQTPQSTMTSEPLKVEYKQLGKSGLRVSVPILGASWQSWVIDEQEALPRVKAAYERDLNTWDTANVYSNVFSEEVMAKLSKSMRYRGISSSYVRSAVKQ